jgi:hypothetical protein
VCKKDYETEEEARAQQRAVEPLTNDEVTSTNENVIFLNAVVGINDLQKANNLN